jgi:hypothetical protein
MKLTVPDTVDRTELQEEIIGGLADRLRDEHGYELEESASSTPSPSTHTVRTLLPHGSIVVDSDGALTVSLHRVDVDARDLFIAVLSELEQRHEGIRAELD